MLYGEVRNVASTRIIICQHEWFLSILSEPEKRAVLPSSFFWRFNLRLRIDGYKQTKSCDNGDSIDISVFRDSKTERMSTMKGFEEIMNIGNFDLKGLVIEESPRSLIVTAKKKIYVPEKKIILMDRMTEHESELFMGVSKNKGGLIV